MTNIKPREKGESDEDENDIISTTIGEYGRWQLQLTFILSLFNIPCTWHIFAPTFQAAERDVWCARPSDLINIEPNYWKNITQPNNNYCNIINYKSVNYTMDNITNIINLPKSDVITCTNWEFSGIGETLISEFNLICDRKELINLAEMMFLSGVAVGGLICGAISDKYGRKRTLMISIFMQSVLGTLIAFVPWFQFYYILRAALGFFSISIVFSAFVLTIELVGGKWRTVAGVCYMFPVSLGYVSVTGIAWLLRDWSQLQLALSLPGFLFIGLWWILPESPRWLLAMGRTKEVMKILENAALVNSIQLPQNLDKQLLPTINQQTKSLGVLDLFKIKKLRIYTMYLLVIWFSVYLVYYGLVLNLGNLGGDLYLNSILVGVVEVPALAVSILILLRMGRKWPLSFTMIFSGIFCLFTLSVPYLLLNGQWLSTTFTMAGKLLITSSNAIMPIFTAELYPTTLRNIGVGINNVLAGVALMIVPYLWNLVSFDDAVPMGVLGTVGVIGGICVMFLPDTGNTPLKDNVEETETKISNQINNSEDDKHMNVHM